MCEGNKFLRRKVNPLVLFSSGRYKLNYGNFCTHLSELRYCREHAIWFSFFKKLKPCTCLWMFLLFQTHKLNIVLSGLGFPLSKSQSYLMLQYMFNIKENAFCLIYVCCLISTWNLVKAYPFPCHFFRLSLTFHIAFFS